MSYITDRILAMSFPAENLTAMYRNPMWQVQYALDIKHGPYYKVYNLCVECTYDSGSFHGRVEMYPFDDMHVPPLSLIKLFCESVHSWLTRDSRNVAVIHCKAGKGRTGLMVCAYLVYKGMPVEEALHLYGDRRTYNNQGVTIPSQRRYVSYWSKILVFPSNGGLPEARIPPPKQRELRSIRLYDTLNTESVNFSIKQLEQVHDENDLYKPPIEVTSGVCERGVIRTYSPRYYFTFLTKEGKDLEGTDEKNGHPRVVVEMDTERSSGSKLDCYFDKPICVSGDVRVIFFNKAGAKLFYFCFNTYFLSGAPLQMERSQLDKFTKNAKSMFGPKFCVELHFGPMRAFRRSNNCMNYTTTNMFNQQQQVLSPEQTV